MSTDTPLPSSSDLPTTSTTAPSTWSQFGNGNNVGDYMMSIRKRRSSNQGLNPVDIDNKDKDNNFLNSSHSRHSPLGSTENLNRTDDCGDGEGRNSSSCVSNNSSSPTAYSYSGSALGSESIENLKDQKPSSNNIGVNTTSPSTTKKDEETKANGDSANSTTENSTSASNNNSGCNEDKQDDSLYECNICLDTAKDAVVSMCGHLFCWPCLHQWLETRPNRMLCPVCKAAISKDKVIPLYGRNSTKQEDPRSKVPPRPAGQRTEPEPQTGFQGFGFGDGFHMSFGIGAFPFGYFASSFNFGEPRPGPANRGTAQYEDEQQLSKLFLYLAFLCIAWLLFA